MGKGARTREATAELNRIKKEEEAKAKAKKKKNTIITSIVALALVVVIAGGVCVKAFYYNNGTYLRNKTAATSESLDISATTVAYFFQNAYNTYKSYYGDYFSAITGISDGDSLKDVSYDDAQSWFEYLMEQTETNLNEVIALWEAGHAAGFELTEAQQAIADKTVESTDMSNFSSIVSKEDVKKGVELSNYAGFYKQELIKDYSYDDDTINDYFDENYTDFTTVSYRSYTISYDESSDETEESSEDESSTEEVSSDESSEETSEESVSDESSTEETSSEESSEESTTEDDTITLKKAEAEVKAMALSSVSSEEEFLEMAEEIQRELNPSASDEDIQTAMDNTLSENISYSDSNEAITWAFDKDRQVGEGYVRDTGEDGSTSGSLVVYYMTKTATKDETKTVNVRHILFTADTYGSDDEAKAKAEEVKAEFESGDQTEDSFAALALEYTEDTGSAYTGGLYENVTSGQMVTNFNDWIFDDARQPGDIDIVQTDYGYHLIYFVSDSYPAWEASVIDTLSDNEYDETLDSLKETYAVTYDSDVIDSIPATA